MAQSEIKSIRDLKLNSKSVFMRLDFNVPIENGRITDDTRIQEALPTILYALQEGAKVVIGSHLGRPDGKVNSEFTLEPIASHLSQLLKQEVTLMDDCVGEGIQMMIRNMKNGSVLLLENLRFHKEEEQNQFQFATDLSKLCDIYVNDAFGTAHRKHASTYGIAEHSPTKAMGLLIEKELKYIGPLVQGPARPFIAILGGSKVSDKIKTIEALMNSVQGLCIGGAMAHAFWAVKGIKIPDGAKQPLVQDIEAARKIIKSAESLKIPLLIPSDTNLGFDIGPKTIKEFSEFVSKAKTIFWNGPLGWFEKPEYARGTFELAQFISTLSAIKIVGGGDTVSAIKASGFAASFDHLSTGGGAVLEFIENGSLPGIEVLKVSHKRVTSDEQILSRDRSEALYVSKKKIEEVGNQGSNDGSSNSDDDFS